MGINPTQPYYEQLETLAASGELANKVKIDKVLFKLCEVVDKQAAEIQLLKDDREAIAKELLSLKPQPLNPTQPLG